MCPRPRASMPGSTASMQFAVPRRFSASTRSTWAASKPSTWVGSPPPALATNRPTGPSRRSARATAAPTAAASVTSQGIASARCPAPSISSTRLSSSGARRATTATASPPAASRRARLRPMPEDAPVRKVTSMSAPRGGSSQCDTAPRPRPLGGSRDWGTMPGARLGGTVDEPIGPPPRPCLRHPGRRPGDRAGLLVLPELAEQLRLLEEQLRLVGQLALELRLELSRAAAVGPPLRAGRGRLHRGLRRLRRQRRGIPARHRGHRAEARRQRLGVRLEHLAGDRARSGAREPERRPARGLQGQLDRGRRRQAREPREGLRLGALGVSGSARVLALAAAALLALVASARAAPGHSVDYLYVQANEGNSSGG